MRRPFITPRLPNLQGPMFAPSHYGLAKAMGNYWGVGKPGAGDTVPETEAALRAAVADPTTGLIKLVDIGVGTITEAKEASIWVKDYQGVRQEFGPNEVAIAGARVTGTVGSRVCYADVPGTENWNILSAPQATNEFINSGAPATQTIEGMAAALRCCWLEGTGSITLSGAASGVVTEGNPIQFDTAGAGDVVCTVAGSVDIAQCEDNPVPTPYIPTAGAAILRDGCELSLDAANHATDLRVYVFELISDVAGGYENPSSAAPRVFRIGTAANIRSTASSGAWQFYDGTNYQGLLAGKLKVGVNQVGLVYGDLKMAMKANGGWSADGPFDGTFGDGSPIGFFQYFDRAFGFRNLRAYDVFSLEDGKALIDRLQP